MKTKSTFQKTALLASLLCGLIIQPAQSKEASYPNRPIRLITGNSPGGLGDLVLRHVSKVLTAELGQAAVVENKPGAEGIIAGSACANAAPDGYTLCLLDAFNWALLPRVKADIPFDPHVSFKPIMLLGYIPSGVWVHPSLPVNSVKELVALARSKPDIVTLASWGRSSTPYLYGELLRKTEAAQFLIIPYRSPTQAWQALLAGQVNAVNYGISVGLPFLASGKLKLLAVNTDDRLPEAPDVPTYSEAGLPVVTVWVALFAPKDTPQSIVDKINKTLQTAIFDNPEERSALSMNKALAIYGPAGKPTRVFEDYLEEQAFMYDKLVKTAGIVPQ